MTNSVEHLQFLEMAEDFYQAFRDLPKKARSGLPISWPRYFMLCHAVELALKAFLLASGVPIKDLENNKKFGHKIVDLMDEARKRGLQIGPLERSELVQLHEAHARYWPRYPRKEGGPIFAIEPFQPYVVKLLEAVRAAIRMGNCLYVKCGVRGADRDPPSSPGWRITPSAPIRPTRCRPTRLAATRPALTTVRVENVARARGSQPNRACPAPRPTEPEPGMRCADPPTALFLESCHRDQQRDHAGPYFGCVVGIVLCGFQIRVGALETIDAVVRHGEIFDEEPGRRRDEPEAADAGHLQQILLRHRTC
jgi:hypothetical protein